MTTPPPAVPSRAPYALGPMPADRFTRVAHEYTGPVDLDRMFAVTAGVERWPDILPHYRSVRFDERAPDGGGLVQMSANRPFGPLDWPTWWRSEMSVDHPRGSIRFRHVEGVTTGMDVEWSFARVAEGTRVRIVHVWNGPRWLPLIGGLAGAAICNVFVQDIAWRTLGGLVTAAGGPWHNAE